MPNAASTPPIVTDVTFRKLVPVIVIGVPVPPSVGVKDVMFGTGK